MDTIEKKSYRERQIESHRRYRAKNKLKISAYNKKYNLENREKKNAHHREYYQKNKAEISEKWKKYYLENREKESLRKRKHYAENRVLRIKNHVPASIREKKWRALNKEKVAASRAKWNEKNLNKKKAHNTLNRAIRAGKIERMPCSDCGELKSEGHHVDYEKPFEVIWLCKQHHVDLHKSLRQEKKDV